MIRTSYPKSAFSAAFAWISRSIARGRVLRINRRFAPVTLCALALGTTGCAHAISRETRQSVLKGLTPETVLRDFGIYQNKLVLMGGEIIETRNLTEESLVEVLQKPLSRHTGRPLENREGNGRFFVRFPDFKDPYVFSQGREMTVAGIVAGKEQSKIGEMEYTYLVVEARETHLWPERADYAESYYYRYPYPYWYPYYPWYSPYPHRRYGYW